MFSFGSSPSLSTSAAAGLGPDLTVQSLTGYKSNKSIPLELLDSLPESRVDLSPDSDQPTVITQDCCLSEHNLPQPEVGALPSKNSQDDHNYSPSNSSLAGKKG